MCGIVGFVRTSSTYVQRIDNLMADLLLFDSVRGDDSTGVFYSKKQYDKGTSVQMYGYAKRAVAGWEFIRSKEFNDVVSTPSNLLFCVGHNRAATRGAVTTDNAHPFLRNNVTLVHNGSLRNHHSMTKELIQVDSEAITECISTKGLKHTVDTMEGAWSLVWHDKDDNTLNFHRNEQRPMVFIVCENLLVFGSEEGILRAALDRNGIKIKEVYSSVPYSHIKFVLDNSKGHVVDCVEETIRPAPKPIAVTPYRGHYGNMDECWDTGYYHQLLPTEDEQLGVGAASGQTVDTTKYPINAVKPHLGVGQDIVFCLLDYDSKGANQGYYNIEGEFMLRKHEHISIVGQASIGVCNFVMNNKRMMKGKIKKIEHIQNGKYLIVEVEGCVGTQLDDPVYVASFERVESEARIPTV